MVDEKPEALKPSPQVEAFAVPATAEEDDVPSPLHQEFFAGPPVPAPGQGAQPDVVAQAAPQDGAPAVPPVDVAQAGDPPPAPGQDRTVVNDRVEAGAPKEPEVIDPYELIDKAQGMARELESLVQQGRKPDEKITVLVNGEAKEMKVSERVAQLKQQMAQQIETAKKGADLIRMTGTATNPGIDDIAKLNTADRDKLVKELNLDPTKLSIDDLGREFQKADGNKARQDKLKELATVMADRDALSRLHFAPLVVRAVEAEFRGRGLLDPSIKLGDEVPDSQIKAAFDQLKAIPAPGSAADVAAFGPGKEINEAKEVLATSEKTVSILYMDQQQQRGLKIVDELALAKKGEGDPEEHYKNAIKIADTLNVGWLANQTYREDNLKAGVSQELVDTVRMGSNARLKYSEFLVSKGRFHEAQGLMAQVKSDSPELIYAQEGDKLVYRQHEDGKTYEQLDRAVTLGVTVNPANFETAQGILFDKLGKDKIGTAADGDAFEAKLRNGVLPDTASIFKHLNSDDATSTESLRMMKLCRTQYKKDITEANQVLDKEVAALDVRKKQFDSKQQLTKDEEVEKARIERQIASLNSTREERENYMKRFDAMTDFTEGVIHLSQGGAKSAHGLFADALKKDPSLDAEMVRLKATNPDLKSISELTAMTENSLSGYWQRNYKKFAVAGAAVAGTLTGVGLIGACGYVGAGITTTAVVATAGGALTGGGVHWGIHRSVNENAGWAEFRDGAKIGGLSAALVASPWAAQAYRAKLGTDAVVATSTIGSMASKIGITKGTLAGSLALSYTFEAGNVLIDGKPIGRAAVDGTKEGVFNSLLMGISRNWGLPTEAGAIKQAAFNRYVWGTGFTLAAAPEAVNVAVDGKPLDKAFKDTLFQGLQYSLMFGLANKMHVTDPSAASGLARFGINKWTVGGGFLMAGAPEAKNYYYGKPGDEAVRDWLTNGLIDTAAFAFLKKYGLSDHGTGTRIGHPTMGQTMAYGGRAFMMQESWNAAISVSMKQVYHDVMGQPYYIKEQGSGFVAPLVADYLDYHYGKGLDPKHSGDRRVINANLDALNTPLTSTLFIDRKPVRPLETGPKKGLFFDYSRLSPRKIKNGTINLPETQTESTISKFSAWKLSKTGM